MYKTLNAQNMKKKHWNESSAELPSHRKSAGLSNRRVFQVLLVSISEDYHFWLANRYFGAWVRTLSYYEDGTQKYSISPLKSRKIELFLQITCQK